MKCRSIFAAVLLSSQPICADTPRIVTDVAPIHSLVSQITDGIADPELLIPATISPHGSALKVSQGRAIANADLIVWVGEALTPWLKKPIESLGGSAQKLELLEVEGLTLLSTDDRDAGDSNMDHEDHDLHGADPHIWLDPDNVQVLLPAIAEVLIQIDRQNENRYRLNLESALAKNTALAAEISSMTRSIEGLPYIVYHDGYRYFEKRFRLGRAIALSNGHAARPGARRMAEVRNFISATSPRCVFGERQLGDRTVKSIVRGTTTVQVDLDPMGQMFDIGPMLYGHLLRKLATDLTGCLK